MTNGHKKTSELFDDLQVIEEAVAEAKTIATPEDEDFVETFRRIITRKLVGRMGERSKEGKLV